MVRTMHAHWPVVDKSNNHALLPVSFVAAFHLFGSITSLMSDESHACTLGFA